MQEQLPEDRYKYTVILVMLITILFTGVNGLVAFILFVVFSRLNLGRDPIYKHGLSSGKSRLGGLAIFISILIGCCSHLFFNSDFNLTSLLIEFDKMIIFSLSIGLIGLVEDLSQSFSSSKRLICMLIFVSVSLWFQYDLVPIDLELFNILGLGGLFMPAYIFTVVMVSGFINAGNIADGANGLLASIFLSFFILAYSIDSSIMNFSIVITLLAFIIFNVFTGKIFLGDFGSYFLSSLVAFKSLEFYFNNNASAFFLGTILVYPCFELSRSLIIRSIKSTSVMSPDNNHFHNYVNTYILNFGISKHSANSITGLSIAFLTTITPICLFFSGFKIDSKIWIILFVSQFLLLSIVYFYFEKKLSETHK